MKVLVVEDDSDVVEIVSLCFGLRWPEAEVMAVGGAEAALAALAEESPDIVLMDLMLPDRDGFLLCRQIREASDVPIIILTARDSELDKVRGLELGADDYITKPFSPVEMLARVRAVLRRAQSQTPTLGEVFEAVKLRIDYGQREVMVAGKAVKLTPIEYGLLYHLTQNAGSVLTYRTLLAKVWGREYITETAYLKVHIQRLRRKLGDVAGSDTMIVNERGLGYKFVAPESAARAAHPSTV
ncbi:MAG: response regulator transcription factor [Dehalococcoidia bacterium]